MPETIGIQPWQVPVGSDPAAVKSDLKRLALNAAAQSNMVFADATERDSVLTAGGLFPPAAGMVAWLKNPGAWSEYTGTSWVVRGAQVTSRRASFDQVAAGTYASAAAVTSVGCGRGRHHISAKAVLRVDADSVIYMQLNVNGSPLYAADRFLLPANGGNPDYRVLEEDFFLPADQSVTVQIAVVASSQVLKFDPGSKVTLSRVDHGPFGF